MANIQKITPFLWFDGRAKEAVQFYTSIFENSQILSESNIQGGTDENPSIISFSLESQAFTALDGGPIFQFSPAISFVVNCETQSEVDHFWERLSEDGEPDLGGWIRDKFGISWQIVPASLLQLLQDTSKSAKVLEALLQMRKIDIHQLQLAYDNA